MMVREKVKVEDFKWISKKYPIFLWNFLQKTQNQVPYSIQSYFDDLKIITHGQNQLLSVLEIIDVPYFESYNDESIDFLMDLGFTGSFLYQPYPDIFKVDHYNHYTPLIIGFKNGQMVSSTVDFCYCKEGIIDLIATLDISLLENANI